MSILDQAEKTPDRFQNFVIFEPASLRIAEVDVLVRGHKVKEIYEEAISVIARKDSLESMIILNRLEKINRMLDLVTNFDALIMTKFLDRIWRRYSHLSNLGEYFLDMKTFSDIFPEYTDKNALLAQRLDEEDDETPAETTPETNLQPA